MENYRDGAKLILACIGMVILMACLFLGLLYLVALIKTIG